MTIEDFADLTGIELEDGPYETVAGYFLSKTGKMGAVGDVLHSDDGYNMVITKVDGRRIETIEVRKAVPRTMRHCQPNHKATMPTSHVIFTTYSFGPGHNQKS